MVERAKDLWAEVEELVRQGKRPLISVPAGARVIKPKRPRGRPRLYAYPTSTYAGLKEMYRKHYPCSPSGRVMRCRRPGCYKDLKRHQTIVCSEFCEREIREMCTMYLAVLDGKMKVSELPGHLRARPQMVGKRRKKAA